MRQRAPSVAKAGRSVVPAAIHSTSWTSRREALDDARELPAAIARLPVPRLDGRPVAERRAGRATTAAHATRRTSRLRAGPSAAILPRVGRPRVSAAIVEARRESRSRRRSRSCSIAARSAQPSSGTACRTPGCRRRRRRDRRSPRSARSCSARGPAAPGRSAPGDSAGSASAASSRTAPRHGQSCGQRRAPARPPHRSASAAPVAARQSRPPSPTPGPVARRPRRGTAGAPTRSRRATRSARSPRSSGPHARCSRS